MNRNTPLKPAAAFLIVGLVPLVIGLASFAFGTLKQSSYKDAVKVTGTVVNTRTERIRDHGHYRRVVAPQVEYTDSSGAKHRIWMSGARNVYPRLGEQQQIEYQRNDPSAAQSSNNPTGTVMRVAGVGLFGLGAVMALIGLIMGLSTGFIDREREAQMAAPVPGPYQPGRF